MVIYVEIYGYIMNDKSKCLITFGIDRTYRNVVISFSESVSVLNLSIEDCLSIMDQMKYCLEALREEDGNNYV